MGRYVRSVLRDFAARPQIDLTLLVREPRRATDYRAIVGDGIVVSALSAARAKRAFDATWYPWNGIRFPSSAASLVTINDDFAFRYPADGFVARQREQNPVRRAVRDAAGIVTISAWSRAVLSARFALRPERISVIPLAPDAYFSPGTEASPFAEPFVLTVGTGEARKNVVFLVGAFERAFPNGTVRLVIVGDPEPALRSRLGAARVPVTILPHVDDAHLRRLYRSAAVVAVPSLAEGFGLVAAEAQACGAVVIAANTSALPEAVGNAGALFGPDDADGWRDALRKLVGNPALNAEYRALALARWPADLREGTARALLAALERIIDNAA
jgi:glycosyltransferase involved in cell wall biosynthesis